MFAVPRQHEHGDIDEQLHPHSAAHGDFEYEDYVVGEDEEEEEGEDEPIEAGRYDSDGDA